MITITTHRGKSVEIISQSELRDPVTVGTRVRAFCHIHGSDHQRSLSIDRTSGWGHCFNAACEATVLVAEWNPQLAERLTRRRFQAEGAVPSRPWYPSDEKRRAALASQVHQLMFLFPNNDAPAWQREEVEALEALERPMRAALARSKRAKIYLHERGIPLVVAQAAGVGYLPSELLQRLDWAERQRVQRWADRLLFPLTSPTGRGYIGRSLCAWKSGMNENEHKALLEAMDGPKRWIKTNPAGWFSPSLDNVAERVVIVEGGFDRLALLTAGFAPDQVIALAGTAAHSLWLPAHVRHVVLALDGDQGGQEAATRLAEEFRQDGFRVSLCLPPQDGRGKDWNERWRRAGIKGIHPLLEAVGLIRPMARTA